MINIKLANEINTEVLALLATLTYTESHNQFIEDKNDLKEYITSSFSVPKTNEELNNPKNLFYIIYVDDLPVGYAKLVLNKSDKSLISQNNCCLERIYILKDYIPLKIGQQLLNFIVMKAKELKYDALWLTVYIKNERAIRFYQKNEFKNVGELMFLVNGKEYENIVFSKTL